MGVFKRYKDAQAARKDAESAVPGAYQSSYTDRIGQVLDAMGAAGDAAADVGTDSEAYRQYRGNAQANARAAAENAAAGAAALSGGYGSSYANSVAQQGYQQAMANVDNGLADLRDRALTEYQVKKSGLSDLFSALMNQDSLEAAQHQTNVANAQDWRDYKKSRADQAAQEKSDWLSNLWEMVKNVGGAIKTGYDTYQGYTQQKWENDFAREQWEYNKERTGQNDALNAYEQAFDLYQQGAGDAANAVLGRYGLDTGIFDNYSGAPVTRADKANALTTAAGLVGSGSDEAARAVLELYGLDPNSVGSYSTIAGRQLATALAKSSSGGSSRRSSGGSSRSSGTKSSGSGWTNSQLQSMAKTFSSMKGDEPLYNFYKQTLTDAGWLEADRGAAAAGTAARTGSGATGGTNAGNALLAHRTPATQSAMKQEQVLRLAAGWKKQGLGESDIIDKLMQKGFSDEDIYKGLNLK